MYNQAIPNTTLEAGIQIHQCSCGLLTTSWHKKHVHEQLHNRQ